MLKRFIDSAGGLRALAASLCAVSVLSVSPAAFAAFPSIVVSSTVNKYATGGMTDPTKVVMDGNGNLFTADSGKNALIGVAAGSTTPVSLLTGLGGTIGVAVDQYNDVIVSASYNGNMYFIPAASIAAALAGGSIGTPINLTSAYGFGSLDGYYASFSDVTVDQNNVAYMAVNYCNSCNGTYSIFSVKTSGATTSTTIGNAGASSLILKGLVNYPTSLAVDTSSHLFFADGTNVYEAQLSASPITYSVFATGFTKPTGVTVDSSGNLFVSDNSSGLLWEIPNESGTLNPADEFVVAQPPNLYVGVAFDHQGNFYSADGYAQNSIDKTNIGGVNFGPSPVGTAANNVNMIFSFSAKVTPASIIINQGAGAATEFNIVYYTCSTTVATTAGHTCLVDVGFKPSSTGVRRGSVVMLNASGKPIATGYMTGIGTGAALTFDPGTQSSLTAFTWKTPSAVALDGASNFYVADSTANVVDVISSTGVAKATIGSGLIKPQGVAVDGSGNVFISDTGNNRIVVVPNENGTLNSADQVVVLGSGLNAPLGITVGPYGSVFVADSGNSRVLRLSTVEGFGLVTTSTVGSGYKTPAGVATDSSGNVYVTDYATGQIDEFNMSTFAQTVALKGALSGPTAISIDASGSAYVVNTGNSTVLRIPSVSGSLNPNTELTLGSLSLLNTPSGVAVNGSGNVVITDSGVPGVFALVRTTGSVPFGPVDTSQSSLSQTLTLTSAGTSSLTLGATAYASSGATNSFAVTPATNNPCSNSSTMTIGATCGYGVVFSPATTGPLTDTLTFSTNAVNAPSLTALLTGTGTNLPQTTTTLTVNPAGPYYGQTVVVTATVTPTQTATPLTGTITFYVDGIAQKPIAISGKAPYSATYTFPALSLTASSHVMDAAYSGDTADASSDAPLLNLVITRAPSVTTASVYPTVQQPLGSAFTWTVGVAPVAQGSPTGTVELVAVGTATPVLATATLASGAATLSYAPPAYGTYCFQVVYVGDVNFNPSTSNTTCVTPQAVGYTVTIPSSSFTVTDGSSIAIPITITGISGYQGNVTVGAQTPNGVEPASTPACTGLPAYVTCSFSPGIISLSPSLYPASNPSGVMTLTLATSVPPPTSVGSYILWPGALAGTLALALGLRRRRDMKRARLLSLLFGLVLGSLALGVTGCGSGTSTQYATPKGTATFTLTFSGTGLQGTTISPTNPNIVQAYPVTITVQ